MCTDSQIDHATGHQYQALFSWNSGFRKLINKLHQYPTCAHGLPHQKVGLLEVNGIYWYGFQQITIARYLNVRISCSPLQCPIHNSSSQSIWSNIHTIKGQRSLWRSNQYVGQKEIRSVIKNRNVIIQVNIMRFL